MNDIAINSGRLWTMRLLPAYQLYTGCPRVVMIKTTYLLTGLRPASKLGSSNTSAPTSSGDGSAWPPRTPWRVCRRRRRGHPWLGPGTARRTSPPSGRSAGPDLRRPPRLGRCFVESPPPRDVVAAFHFVSTLAPRTLDDDVGVILPSRHRGGRGGHTRI